MPPDRRSSMRCMAPAGDLGVDHRHREQDPVDVAVHGVHLRTRPDSLAEVFTRVGVRDRGRDPVEPGTLHEVRGDRVEQAGPGTEDQIDGGPGHPGRAGDLLDARRLRRRLA
jgi:hypothetical protein